MTALRDAFVKAGVSPALAALRVALSAFINAGGTTAQVRAELDAIDRDMSAAGHKMGADQSLGVSSGPIGDQITGVTQYRYVSEAGGDQRSAVTRADAVPAREPTPRQRQIAAEVRTLTVLDTFKIRDGRCIGDVRYGEVERLRAANAMEAAIFKQIQMYCKAPHDAKIRNLITAQAFQRIQQAAAEAVDAA